MMKTHKASRLRMLGGTAAVILLAGAGLTLGSPGVAAQQGAATPEAKQERAESRDERREERVIVRTHRIDGDRAGRGEARDHADHADRDRHVHVIRTRRHGEGEGAGGHGDHRVRAFHLDRAHGEHLAMAECGEGDRTEVNEGDGNARTRIVLCTRGGDSAPAERAERLQRVRDQLAQDEELSAEQRARVGAAIDREIARLRAR